ncbi:Serine arginine-rich splicing factor 2 [Dionaea muscipula]
MSYVPLSPPPPPPPPLSPPQPPPERLEITIFVDFLPKNVGRRELLSIFSPFGSVSDVFIPRKCSRSRSRFGFVRFGSEEAAGMTVLKVDGLKLQDSFLHVKKAVFGRDALGSRSGMAAHPPVVCQARMVGGQTGSWRGSTGDLEVHNGNTGGVHFLSYKAALQRGNKEDTERQGREDETMDGGYGDEAEA